MAEPIVKIRELSKIYNQGEIQVTALNRITLDIAAGEFLALMGPSGSGKSTLLHIIAGVDRPTSGDCLVQGVDVTKLNETQLADWRNQNVGFIFQTFNLIPVLTAAENVELPLLLQGDSSKAELLARFRSLGNAVLVASQSFWEGVDVRGDALSLVVIDKLPFAPPDDPVLAARIEQMKKSGRNAFMEYQLPRTVISMKQGAGRLIRDETDRGVLMICDPRLIDKHYGRRVWRSLPPMRRSRDIAEVLAFFSGAAESAAALPAKLAS